MKKQKVFITGIDGYIGWALANFLIEKGYEVTGIDNLQRRNLVCRGLHSDSLFPIASVEERMKKISFREMSTLNYKSMRRLIKDFKPDAIVHLGEQASAPFSMRGRKDSMNTQKSNILGTLNLLWIMKEVCPDAHLVKLGSMSVYGSPDNLIEECGKPYPYDPPSFYHISKAADSINSRKCAEWWNLRITDVQQGVVYGHLYDTRFDYDQCFGTVLNRFIVQSLIGHPLTVYGTGSQSRGFIYLKNSIECLELAIRNPAERGQYRVFNQLTEKFPIIEIANLVSKRTGAKIEHIQNPRIERENYNYQIIHKALLNLGLKPILMKDVLGDIIKAITPFTSRVKEEVMMPTAQWRNKKCDAEKLVVADFVEKRDLADNVVDKKLKLSELSD
jgi:UDP-sulfoquinovose synthase